MNTAIQQLTSILALIYGCVILFWFDSFRHFSEAINYTHYLIPFHSRSSIYFKSLLEPAGLLCLIFISVASIPAEGAGPRHRHSVTILHVVCVILIAITLLGFVPCIMAPGALCGVFAVVLLQWVSPFFIPIAVLYVILRSSKGVCVLGVLSCLAFVLAVSSFISFRAIHQPAECDRLSPEKGPSFERDRCYIHFAEVRAEPTWCPSIETTSTRDSCYLSVSRLLKDPSYCKRIESSRFQQSCDQLLAGSP